jgi:hypothetical protein
MTPGQTILGANDVLPDTSVPMIGHMQKADSDFTVIGIMKPVILDSTLEHPLRHGQGDEHGRVESMEGSGPATLPRWSLPAPDS